MPVLAMAEPVVDHQKRFQAAVDVIHNLPKNGSYRPSYEVMLRFYSLYKQAMCGPCTVPRPSFWDPVGRCKWDAWSRLGEMSSENAMAAYVDEIKKVAQEVLDTMPMNEKTASLFHHFESLYLVIDDMPQPPESLFTIREGLKCSKNGYRTVEMKTENNEQDSPNEDSPVTECEQADQDFSLTEVLDPIANTVPHDSGVSEGLMLTSDSENEIFCDSVDSVEQLSAIKIPVVEYNGFHNSDVVQESFPTQSCQLEGGLVVRQVGAGQGGEGAEDGKGQGHLRRTRDSGQEGSYHGWRECGVPQGRQRQGAQGGGGGARRGGDGSEDATERVLDAQLQQQIILALRRLREDMRSVMDRLEVVERLAATHTQSSQQRPYLHCAASTPPQQEEGWLPFDVSCQTIFFLLWPFVTQGLVYLLRKAQRRSRISS